MIRANTPEELSVIASDFLRSLMPIGRATIVTLSGELGAGKTSFVQAVARELGVRTSVQSPTFTLEKIYILAGQRWKRLIHIDAYRMKDSNELISLGWEDLTGAPGTLIFLEWPERVSDVIPSDATRVRFDIDGDARIITINGEKEST